jgi:hypothetical protein
MLRDCDQQLTCFYAESEKLAELDHHERQQRLDQMSD